MIVRSKRCVVCNKSFKPYNTSLQRACSWKCAKTFGELKELVKNKGLNDVRNEKTSLVSLEKAKTNTRMQVHAYIRKRDKGKPCISCGTKWRSDFQAGHFYSAGKYNMLRYDLNNIHAQCPKCNLFDEGAHDSYNIASRISVSDANKLSDKATLNLKILHTWTRYELKQIRDDVKQLTKTLTKL